MTANDAKTCPHCGEDHNGVTGCRPKVSTNYNRWLDIASKAGVGTEPEPKPAYSHNWSRDGERCSKCGDKDWMGGPCSKPDEAKPATEPQRERQIEKNYDHRHISGPNTLGEHGQLVRVKVVEASRLIDARLTLIDQEVSRQSALKLLDAARRERDEWKKKYEADVITAVLCKDMEIADKITAANHHIAELEASRIRLSNLELEALKGKESYRQRSDAWRSAALRLREALDKVLPAGTWFHLGPYGASPEKDDYDKACLALKEFDAFVAKEKKK